MTENRSNHMFSARAIARSPWSRAGPAAPARPVSLAAGKVLLEALPAFEVVMLKLRGFDGIARQPHREPALEHERHSVLDLVRLERHLGGPLPGLGVRAVRGHAIVQAGAARQEAFRLGVVGAMQQAHELGHDVAVKPRRPERVLGDEPAWRENHEIDIGGAGEVRRSGEHAEDRRIRMIEAHRAHRHEAREVVFAGHEVAVPGDDVERRVVHLRRPQIALELGQQDAWRLHVFVGCDRGEEIARVGKPVGAEWPELRQPQHGAIVLADVAARRPVRQLHPETQAARNDHDLAGRSLDDAKLGDEARAALLRDDQHFPVGIVEAAVGHRAVGGIDMDRHADLRRHVAIAAEGHQTFNEIGGLLRNRQRAPAQLRRRRVDFLERRAADHAVVGARIGPMHHRGLDPVGPGAAIFPAGGGEGGAGDLLGIKAERRALRRVAADRQRPGDRLGFEIIAEAGLVAQRHGRARNLVFGHTRLRG